MDMDKERETEQRNRRKTKLETIQFYRSDFAALLALPGEQLRTALDFISDYFDSICERSADRKKVPELESMPGELSRGAKRLLHNVISNLAENAETYWRKCATNTANRARAIQKGKEYCEKDFFQNQSRENNNR